jgi:hypothetical protein
MFIKKKCSLKISIFIVNNTLTTEYYRGATEKTQRLRGGGECAGARVCVWERESERE